MSNDEIIVENADDEGSELHVKANKDGVSFDLVKDGKIIKSAWMLMVDDVLEMLH